jgi:hypothetical protein
MFTSKDLKQTQRAKLHIARIEAAAGERISSGSVYAKDGFIYFTLLASSRRMACKMNACGKVARVFPQV